MFSLFVSLCLLKLHFLVSDSLGKEVVSLFTTDLDTDQTWYTDANGREMQERRYNYTGLSTVY